MAIDETEDAPAPGFAELLAEAERRSARSATEWAKRAFAPTAATRMQQKHYREGWMAALRWLEQRAVRGDGVELHSGVVSVEEMTPLIVPEDFA